MLSETVHETRSEARPTATVLLVDDDRAGLLAVGSQIEQLGYRVTTATNGAEAFTLLREDPSCADVVMTDRIMPILDGMGLTRRLKRERDTRSIPVIMLTGASEEQDVSGGIEAGAFYYLTKPPSEKLMAAVLSSALQEVARQRKLRSDLMDHQAAFKSMQVMRFKLRMPEEVEPVVSMLASMHERPDRTIQGIYELVQNGIEHGVLRFGFKRKAELLREGRWQEALMERAHDPAYADGWVEATGMRREDGIYVSVKDNGPGFDWRAFLISDPSRAAAPCGRGISRAATFAFDRLTYDGSGKQVVGYVANLPRLRW
ncbi:response regulator [Afifella sp. IM 167]|uniref:ATP-binding response regulator n=1 Tax=Afifella sp. IM 167 TaxID=2033586 RepID=UPI001CCDA6E9|nr:response regulator [Afifella sp. IM 167]MBZ8135425.1 response regulator receiver protein [Afifella sp. IM 167]